MLINYVCARLFTEALFVAINCKQSQCVGSVLKELDSIGFNKNVTSFFLIERLALFCPQMKL